jgi:hypothetical protein
MNRMYVGIQWRNHILDFINIGGGRTEFHFKERSKGFYFITNIQ